jgi:hypothetical protein
VPAQGLPMLLGLKERSLDGMDDSPLGAIVPLEL